LVFYSSLSCGRAKQIVPALFSKILWDGCELNAILNELKKPIAPFRTVDKKTYSTLDSKWETFQGDCVKVMPEEIIISTFSFKPKQQAVVVRRLKANSYMTTDESKKYHEVTEMVNVGKEKVEGPKIILRNYPALLFPAVGKEIVFKAIRVGTADFSGDLLEVCDYGQESNDFRDKLLMQNAKKVKESQLQLIENEKQISPINLNLLKLKNELHNEIKKINIDYEAKVKSLPNDYAKQLEDSAGAKRQAVQDKIFKNYQDAAAQGDPVGLLRMGEHYRDGDGVEKNLAKARDYFSKAAEAGSPSASEALKRLPQN